MSKKPAKGEFMEGILARVSAGRNTKSSFHTSMFKSTFEGLKSRFRELSESK